MRIYGSDNNKNETLAMASDDADNTSDHVIFLALLGEDDCGTSEDEQVETRCEPKTIYHVHPLKWNKCDIPLI